jgi:hypothetical protein
MRGNSYNGDELQALLRALTNYTQGQSIPGVPQVNKPYDMNRGDNNEVDPNSDLGRQIAERIADRQRTAGSPGFSSIGKTPPGWPNAQLQDGMYRVPDGQGVPLGSIGLNSPIPVIPRATPNQYGMTRLSPGMYKDKSGNVVRSKTGAPAPVKTKETAKVGTRG